MGSSGFHFGPQPALDRAVAERRRCEEALAEARRVLADERGRLRELERIHSELRQQLRGELARLSGDAGSGCSAAAMAVRGRFADLLSERCQRHEAGVAEQAGQVALTEEKVRIRIEELNEAIGAAKALDSVKTRMLERHRREENRKEMHKIEDAVLARHNRGSTRT